MNSRIYTGYTTHSRKQPVDHRFRYRMYWFGIDLDELDLLDRTVRGFGHNRRSLLSIREQDYGGPGEGMIKEKILRLLDQAGIEKAPERIILMTIPRIAGYVFNPVNFYMCHGEEGELAAMLCEVRNTFGEVHHYVAPPEADGAGVNVFRFPKRFYVSPFLANEGMYTVVAQHDGDNCNVAITLEQEGKQVFSASMVGAGVPIRSANTLTTLLRLPMAAILIMTRIQWQALHLRLRRKIHPAPKPAPSDPATIPAPHSSIWYSIRDRLIRLASNGSERHKDRAVNKERMQP